MTKYDQLRPNNDGDDDDEEAIDDLEIELASQTGRLTGIYNHYI